MFMQKKSSIFYYVGLNRSNRRFIDWTVARSHPAFSIIYIRFSNIIFSRSMTFTLSMAKAFRIWHITVRWQPSSPSPPLAGIRRSKNCFLQPVHWEGKPSHLRVKSRHVTTRRNTKRERQHLLKQKENRKKCLRRDKYETL